MLTWMILAAFTLALWWDRRAIVSCGSQVQATQQVCIRPPKPKARCQQLQVMRPHMSPCTHLKLSASSIQRDIPPVVILLQRCRASA